MADATSGVRASAAVRVAITTQPGSGHLNRLLGLALALREAGHEPTLCGAASLRGQVESQGLAFAPAGVDWQESALVSSYPDYVTERPDGTIALDPALWAHLARPMADDLDAVIGRLEPRLVIADAFEFGGQLAAERRALPFAVVDSLAAGPVFAQRRRFAAPLDPVRAALGLPPDPDGNAPYRHGRLLPVPARYHDARPLPPTTVAVNLGLPGPPPPDAQRAPAGDAPLVLASLGTVLYAQDGVREAILDALRDEPVRLVLALGPDADPARWGRVGPNNSARPPRSAAMAAAALRRVRHAWGREQRARGAARRHPARRRAARLRPALSRAAVHRARHRAHGDARAPVG